MRRQVFMSVVAVCLAAIGIAAAPATLPTLRIARLTITEIGDRTVITAVDTRKQPIARLDLVHGRFIPTEDFGPEFRGRPVVGRKLYVEVSGQTIAWETIGFSDTRHMPPLPPNLNLVTAFLADGRVRAVLDKWRIGWAAEPVSVVSMNADVLPDDAIGTDPVDCSGLTSCPLTVGQRAFVQSCNGAYASQAFVVSRDAATFGTDENLVSACCAGSGAPAYMVKACGPHPGAVTSCGPAPSNQRCRPCPGSPAPYTSNSCSLTARVTGSINAAGLPIYRIHHCDAAPGTPPTIAILRPEIQMWPPDRKMHAFDLADFASALDACGDPIDVNERGSVTSITSNEGGSDDFAVTGPASFSLRADRDGTGRGRIYEIAFSVVDLSGNAASAAIVVGVPHDQRGSRPGK